MSWYKKSQQGLLFYPWKKAPYQTYEKASPIGKDPETGENIYRCNLCGNSALESSVEWYNDTNKANNYTMPAYSNERITNGINEIVQYLRPFLQQLEEYLQTQKPDPNLPVPSNQWWIANQRLRGWEVQIPLMPQIFSKYPELSDFCAYNNDSYHRFYAICGLHDKTEINGEELDKLSSFIKDPSEIINNILEIPKKQIETNLKAPLCEECQGDLEKCDFCGKIIFPGQEKYPTIWSDTDYACEKCIEDGRASTCVECGKSGSSDEMMYTNEEGPYCENCYKGRSEESIEWASNVLSNIDIPVGKNLPISEKILNNLSGFVSRYMSKYNCENSRLSEEWERISYLSKKSGLTQGAIEYLNNAYSANPKITIDNLMSDIENNLSAQKYMKEQYPDLSYQDMMYDVEVVESYNTEIPGFTIAIKPSKNFFAYAVKKYPNIHKVWEVMNRTPHHNGYLAYARCAYDGGDNIVINNLQRDADYDNYSSRASYNRITDGDDIARWIDQMTKHWDVFLLNLLKAIGIAEEKSVFLTSFDQQKRKWGRLPIHKSKRTYQEVPEMMGFPRERGRDIEGLMEGGQGGDAYRVAKYLNWFKRAQSEQTIKDIVNKWSQQGITLYVYDKGNKILLDSLIVPKEKRNKGIGSQIMNELTNYADSVGKRLELSPGQKDDYHGTTSRNRLVDFYKRFGLIENKGRNKDFTTTKTMYREPKA